MHATAKKPTEIIDTIRETETDVRRRARLNLAHRRALFALAAVTLRYQVHNEFAELRESETRIHVRGRP